MAGASFVLSSCATTNRTAEVATNATLPDFKFIEHYSAPGELKPPATFSRPTWGEHGTPTYEGVAFGVRTSIQLYGNMTFVRFQIPNKHYAALLSELISRYGSPQKDGEEFKQWKLKIGGELRCFTLFKEGAVTIERNGRKSSPDFNFDISRMKRGER